MLSIPFSSHISLPLLLVPALSWAQMKTHLVEAWQNDTLWLSPHYLCAWAPGNLWHNVVFAVADVLFACRLDRLLSVPVDWPIKPVFLTWGKSDTTLMSLEGRRVSVKEFQWMKISWAFHHISSTIANLRFVPAQLVLWFKSNFDNWWLPARCVCGYHGLKVP